jgi:hypothetical protein
LLSIDGDWFVSNPFAFAIGELVEEQDAVVQQGAMLYLDEVPAGPVNVKDGSPRPTCASTATR